MGTHALIEPKVVFHRLGLAVIDEQHRFGVAQRASFGERRWPHPGDDDPHSPNARHDGVRRLGLERAGRIASGRKPPNCAPHRRIAVGVFQFLKTKSPKGARFTCVSAH